jgi:hypothetical protein
MREIRFGVETETVRRTREQVARDIHSVVGGTVQYTGQPNCYAHPVRVRPAANHQPLPKYTHRST